MAKTTDQLAISRGNPAVGTTYTMSDKPIPFSGPMVRAILGGRKTQTRRMVKPQPVPFGKSGYGGTRQGWKFDPEGINRSWNDDDKDQYRGEPLATMAMRALCPYGQPGDCLWVKEDFTFLSLPYRGQNKVKIQYAADGERRTVVLAAREVELFCQRQFPLRPTRARFMYRSCARINLEITGVRVEQLQDISDDDAIAEGVDIGCPPHEAAQPLPVMLYERLWQSIHGPGSWAANPWVWVVEFKPTKGGDSPAPTEPH